VECMGIIGHDAGNDVTVYFFGFGPASPGTGIYGHASYNRNAAPSIPVDLMLRDAGQWYVAATTLTNQNGDYLFAAPPTLTAQQVYMVRYANDGDSRYLWDWYCPEITSYASGDVVHGGDFDIADIVQTTPAHGATVSLPQNFAWQNRGVSGDSYYWRLFDPVTTDQWWVSDLGDVSGFTLTGVSGDVLTWRPYGWDVWVCQSIDSCGSSYYYREVTFAETASSTRSMLQEDRPGGWGARRSHKPPDE